MPSVNAPGPPPHEVNDSTQATADQGTVLRWTAGGIAFGLGFPVMGVLVASGGSLNMAAAHSAQPILYIIDVAPIVLGVVGMALGRIHGNLIRTRDEIEQTVTERTHELETALADLRKVHAQLVQAQRLEAIGSLAAGVAHEINTPIQYVGDNLRFLEESFGELLSFQQVALEFSNSVRSAGGDAAALARFDAAVKKADFEFLNEEIPSATSQAMQGVERVSEIVLAMKAFSHPGTPDKAPVDVNRAIENTIAVSRSEWKYVADVVTDLEPDLPEVRALSGPLNQALLIIIVNAAQALDDRPGDAGAVKGQITVTTRSSNEFVEIAIADNAGGIPEDVQHRIFDPFFTTKAVGRGSGQGLGIAWSAIVDQHDGHLSFEVLPQHGTTFTILLPRDSEGA